MEASQNGAPSDCGRTGQVWPSAPEQAHRAFNSGNGRSPPELAKMKAACHNGQCGGVYDGLSNPGVNGHGHHCQQQSPHWRLHPAYVQQQQQHQLHPVSGRVIPQHHQYHHPGSIQGCHSHPLQGQAQQQPYPSATNGGPVPHPHMDRMMNGNGGASAAAASQMRSVVMNHYPAAANYAYPHHSSGSSSGYYAQAVATTTNAAVSANGHCMDYGHGVAANGGGQYPQHAMNGVPQNSMNSFRAVQNLGAHHPKVMNSSQAALYQNAYHQHYQQYLQQQHGMMQSHRQNGLGPGTAGSISMASHHQQQVHQQQQSRLLQYMSRVGQAVPQQQHHHNHVYPTSCHSHMMPNGIPQPLLPQLQAQVQEGASGQKSADVNNNAAIQTSDGNSKSSNGEATDAIKERKGLSSESDIRKVSNRSRTPSMKITSVKLKCRSPERLVKIKATKSATKIRDRQPRLVLGRKKKSTGNISVISSGKKLKSYLKASSNSNCNEIGNECPDCEMKKPGSPRETNECIHGDSLCATRPPPGFEHLTRPAFPIEMYDPSLLGILIGCQLSRDAVFSDSAKQFVEEELQEILSLLPPCELGQLDFEELLKYTRKSLERQDEGQVGDDWEALNKDINNAVDDWTEELQLIGRVQTILHDGLAIKSINLFKDF